MIVMPNKTSFIIHLDSLDVIDDLSDEQCGELLRAMKAYHLEDDFTPSFMVKLAFLPFRNRFVADEIKSRRGEHHWNWKGGITEENHALRNSAEYSHWRINVFERDGFMCMECGSVGGVLNAHHIKPWATYPELRFDIDNGQTLCEECHKEVHRA